jgi:hypothetical protein
VSRRRIGTAAAAAVAGSSRVRSGGRPRRYGRAGVDAGAVAPALALAVAPAPTLPVMQGR